MERFIEHQTKHCWKTFGAILFFFQPIPDCYFGGDAALDVRSYVTKIFPTNKKTFGYRNEFIVRCAEKNYYISFDVWLTVHRNSVWIRKTN